jgi:hypothetical protein
MKPESKKRLTIATNFLAITTIIFFILSTLNAGNLSLSLISEASLSSVILLIVIHAFTVRKQKLLGCFLIGAFAFSLYNLINTILIGFKVGF